MQSESDKPAEPAAVPLPAQSEPGLNRSAKPIAELLLQPGFPKSALGETVDIGGYIGVVADVVNQSLKVRSSEGVTKSFNAGGLRKLYGPRVLPEPYPQPHEAESPAPPRPRAIRREETPSPPPPKREVVAEPDFAKPVKKISDLARLPDFPKCALGEHVEIAGYTGVVVEIVNRSLKVRSQAEITRSYNADALRRLYG